MRNTVMQEKLKGALSIGLLGEESKPAPAPASKGASAKKAKAHQAATGKKEVLGPRYVPPPKRANPFAVHVFPVAATAMREEFPSPEPAPEGSQSHSVSPAAVEQLPPSEPIRLSIQESPQPCPTLVEVATGPETAVPLSEVSLPEPFKAAPAAELAPIAAEGVIAESVATSPGLVLPSDLSWLDKPTPFSSPLKGMVDNLRDAKTRIAFQMEQERARKAKLEGEVSKLQDELFTVEFRIEEQREGLRRIDDIISACALVAEQSVSIDPRLLAANGGANKKAIELGGMRRKYARPAADDPSILRAADLRKFFTANPDIKWAAKEILEQLPAIKRAHGKKSISVVLASMTNAGEIERVGPGTYRKAATQQRLQAGEQNGERLW